MFHISVEFMLRVSVSAGVYGEFHGLNEHLLGLFLRFILFVIVVLKIRAEKSIISQCVLSPPPQQLGKAKQQFQTLWRPICTILNVT